MGFCCRFVQSQNKVGCIVGTRSLKAALHNEITESVSPENCLRQSSEPSPQKSVCLTPFVLGDQNGCDRPRARSERFAIAYQSNLGNPTCYFSRQGR
jgi:hypothetical protein